MVEEEQHSPSQCNYTHLEDSHHSSMSHFFHLRFSQQQRAEVVVVPRRNLQEFNNYIELMHFVKDNCGSMLDNSARELLLTNLLVFVLLMYVGCW